MAFIDGAALAAAPGPGLGASAARAGVRSRAHAARKRCGGRGSDAPWRRPWARFGQPCGALLRCLSHNNLALIVRVPNPQPPLRNRPSLRRRRGRPRRARLAPCRGSFLLLAGSARRVSAYIREGQPESIKRGLWKRSRRERTAQRRSGTPGTCLQAAVPPQGSRARRDDHDGPPAPVVGRQRLVPCGPTEAK